MEKNKITEILNDLVRTNDSCFSEIKVFTGKGGANDFDTEMIIQGVNHEELKNRYRKVRTEKYQLENKLEKLKYNKLIRVLRFFKLINID